MVMVRRAMTEVLLKVTNTEIMKICQEELYRNRHSNNAGTLTHTDLELNKKVPTVRSDTLLLTTHRHSSFNQINQSIICINLHYFVLEID